MNVERIRNNRIGASFVTYHPDSDFPHRLCPIAKYADEIVIVDNGSNERAVRMLRDLASRLSSRLILNEDNLGIATALNQAANEAIKRNYQWLLTMDQDSAFETGMADAYFRCFHQLKNKSDIAIVSPAHGSLGIDRYSPPTCDFDEEDIVQSTGNLVNLSLFKHIGGFEDKLFLDEFDHDYCLRARLKGYRVIQFKDVILRHHPGELRSIPREGKTRHMSVHSPERMYYMTRNSLYVWTTYYRFFPDLVKARMRQFRKQLRYVLFHDEYKWKKLWNVARGVLSFVFGRYGK